jgi:hypothetical protein
MALLDDITIDIEEAEGWLTIATFAFRGKGAVRLMGTVSVSDRVLYIEGAHIEGMFPGALGRKGLNALAAKLLEAANVDKVVVYGSRRSTGKRASTTPRPIRFPR